MELNTIQNKSNWGKATESINTNFAHVGSEIDKLKYAAYNSKLYPSLEVLQQEKPNPSVGDWAIVGDTIPGAIYRCSTEGVWSATGETGGGYGMNVTEKNVTENNHYGDIVNNPDNEDLTEETNENEGKVMKLADKEYNAAGFSGLGRLYLRKSISLSKNVLTQDMINKANTRYIVQYDHDLNGGTIDIPENCELEFQGGLLSNGVLSFSKPCNINADRQIFNGVTLQKDSVFCDTDINPAWFGVKGDGITDDTEAIKYMLSFCKNIRNKIHEMRNGADYSPRIVFKKRAYYKITSPIYINFKCHILGDPVFLYTGESIAEDINNFSTTGAAIIITSQYNTTFEFSVVRMKESYVDSTSITTDLSDGIQFAAVKTGTCVWCNFKIHQIFGFNTGVYMRCKGFDCTWQCIFDVHYISWTKRYCRRNDCSI